MRKTGSSGLGSRLAVGIAGAAVALALPSAGLAVSLMNNGSPLPVELGITSFTPATADPAVARLIASRGEQNAQMMRFTPAGAAASRGRSVTVAVRVDEESARALASRSALGTVRPPSDSDGGPHIAPTRYNLGLARGYTSFAQPKASPVTASVAAAPSIPDLAEFKPSAGAKKGPSRFAATIHLDEERGSVHPQVAQRADTPNDQSLDVVGSYRLTRNLDVSAGVRYEQQREHLLTMPDVGPKDSQAVYIGTQFRF